MTMRIAYVVSMVLIGVLYIGAVEAPRAVGSFSPIVF